ncbi:MAG TPA: DUF2911 domain-containing protein, partial [Chryseosolibacter sp.]
MKSMYLFSALFLIAGLSGQAQVVLPDASPFATLTQQMGGSEVLVEYSRPGVKGRVIFGELVPYRQLWRAGANASTKLFTREELLVQDQYKLPPGVYAIYVVPDKEEWTIILSRDSWLWGTFGYKEIYDAVRFKVKSHFLEDPLETFTVRFANICSGCAELQLLWEHTKVGFRISTTADEKAMADIKAFASNPEAKMAGEYYLAAKYYLDTQRDYEQALTWIDKALAYAPGAYWMTHTKAEILAKKG